MTLLGVKAGREEEDIKILLLLLRTPTAKGG
jgi:hypothetical protein